MGSGKRENLSPTSNSLKRSRAFSFTLFLEANRKQRRDTPAPSTPQAPREGFYHRADPSGCRRPLTHRPAFPPTRPGKVSPLCCLTAFRGTTRQHPGAAEEGPGRTTTFPALPPAPQPPSLALPYPRADSPFPFASRPTSDRRLVPPISTRDHRAPPSDWRRAGQEAGGASRRGCARRSRRRGGAEGRGGGTRTGRRGQGPCPGPLHRDSEVSVTTSPGYGDPGKGGVSCQQSSFQLGKADTCRAVWCSTPPSRGTP